MTRTSPACWAILALSLVMAMWPRVALSQALPPPQPVIKIEGIARFLQAAQSRRVDIIGIFDSNGTQLTYTGHHQGMNEAFSAKFGTWGTSIAPAHAAGGQWGSRVGGSWVFAQIGSLGIAPTEFLNGCLDISNFSGGPEGADYITDHLGSDSRSQALRVASNQPLSLFGALRYGARLYLPPTGAATTLYPSLISNIDGNVNGIAYPATPTPVPLPQTSGFFNWYWNIPVGATVNQTTLRNPSNLGDGFQFRLHTFQGPDITGSYGFLYNWLEDPARYFGIRYSRFITLGGQPTRAPATSVCNYSDFALGEYFRTIAGSQVDESGRVLAPMLLVQIIEGGNDVGDSFSSIVYPRGAGARNQSRSGNAPGDTKQGYKNNTQAIINRLRDTWVAAGYAERNLFFLIGCYHPHNPSDAQWTFVGQEMVLGMRELAAENQNVTGVDGYRLLTTDNFAFPHPIPVQTQDGFFFNVVPQTMYRNPLFDRAHLMPHAYQQWGYRVVDALHAAAIKGRVWMPEASVAGRCCLASSCIVTTQQDCELSGGVHAIAAPCDPGACVFTGRCCAAACSISTDVACSAVGGVFLAGGFCAPNACGAQGRCCIDQTTCQLSTQIACIQAGGVFAAGATCFPSACNPAIFVTCCRGATCAILAVGDCAPTPQWQAGVSQPALVGDPFCNAGSLTTPCCFADYDKAAGTQVSDIFAFLQDWFGGSPLAAFGTDGTSAPTTNSIFAFLAAWFAGCG